MDGNYKENAETLKNDLISKTVTSSPGKPQTSTSKSVNRKEGNGQESIRLPNTFCPRHQRERRMLLKQWQYNQNLQAES